MIYLKTSLASFAPEYSAAVKALFEQKIDQCSGLFSKRKAEKKMWQELQRKYDDGPLSQEDAARIIAGLQDVSQEMQKRPRPADIGTLAIVRGACRKIAELVKEDMDRG